MELKAPVRFDGEPEWGTLDGRSIMFLSKRLGRNHYQVVYNQH